MHITAGTMSRNPCLGCARNRSPHGEVLWLTAVLIGDTSLAPQLLRDDAVVEDRQLKGLAVFEAELSVLLLVFHSHPDRLPIHQVG